MVLHRLLELLTFLRIEIRRGVDEHPGARAGLVTSVGVITIVLGLLQLLCGGWFSLVALGALYAALLHPHAVPWTIGISIIGVALVNFVLSALYIVSGIGVIRRQRRCRVMTLVLAGFSGVAGTLMIVGCLMRLPMIPRNLNAAILISLPFLLHCMTSFVVLLNSQNAAEFE